MLSQINKLNVGTYFKAKKTTTLELGHTESG